MNTDLVFGVVLTIVLYGLIKSTENIVNIRQHRRDKGEDIKTYL
jgi:hypothetical protein